MLADIPRLVSAYFTMKPDPSETSHRVLFGTSGHRGSSLKGSFNEDHILAICQAICQVRAENKVKGPLFLGMDTHALSYPAFCTALEVFGGNGITIRIQTTGQGFTPTPVVSHAILVANKGKKEAFADGVIITPSHNPPEDGGIKYNPPNGGPADTSITKKIQNKANELLQSGLKSVKRIPFKKVLGLATTQQYDYINSYIDDLKNIVNVDAIAKSGIKMGVDPLGGSGIAFWAPMAEKYKLNLEIVNKIIDPTFSFMTVDKDGKIRMDCSSPWSMAGLIGLKDRFDIAFGNDPDYDRHGIVTRSKGLLNPNHYLSVAIRYLFKNRPLWAASAAIGKTLVSSAMIDRIAADIGRQLVEVPVGFKWFVDGLIDGSFGFGGEESAGASFLRTNGAVWTTDKDGFIMDLLAAEILATTGKDPGEHYTELEKRFGSALYERMDAPANAAQKQALSNLSPDMVTADTLANEKILAKLTKAPGNNEPIGGLKVVTENGWFAARPSGTEDMYKIYAESFKGQEHLKKIQDEAREIVGETLGKI